MKKKLAIIGIAFIAVICLQIFSTEQTHEVVVDDNIQLTGDNKKLTGKVNKLTGQVNALETKNEELVADKAEMAEMVNLVIGDLDSTKSVVKNIKKELQSEKDINVKQSTGKQFDFQPITLPTEDGN